MTLVIIGLVLSLVIAVASFVVTESDVVSPVSLELDFEGEY